MKQNFDAWLRDAIQECHVVHHILTDDGVYPNNEVLPLLAYQGALKSTRESKADIFEALFEANQWGGSWRNGVYGFHHYHSTAHEVLGVFSGTAKAQFGGEKGIKLTVNSGDVVIIPAGVAHKKLGGSSDFGVVGSYPFGQYYDMCYGKPGERPQTDRNITHVALPTSDPVYGLKGPIIDYWLK